MRQLAQSTINRNIDKLIAHNKFLLNEKYYKNNRWDWVHWESWAAQGKVGGCRCCRAGCYNATLTNTRHNRNRTKKKWPDRIELVKLCSTCVMLVKEKIGVEFKETYAV